MKNTCYAELLNEEIEPDKTQDYHNYIFIEIIVKIISLFYKTYQNLFRIFI